MKIIERTNLYNGNWNKPIILKKKIGNPSLNGAVFLLSDERYVGKLIFYKTPTQRQSILDNEYEIGKKMGELGIGPKVYAFINLDFGWKRPPSNLTLRGESEQQAVLIIMQNLAHGAKKLESVDAYYRRTKKYPVKKVLTMFYKLRKAEVLHGDLHIQNIVVKTFPSGATRIYFIDYGRSKNFMENSNINNLFRFTNLNNTSGFLNTNNNNQMVSSNRYILNLGYRNLTGKKNSLFNKKIKQKYHA